MGLCASQPNKTMRGALGGTLCGVVPMYRLTSKPKLQKTAGWRGWTPGPISPSRCATCSCSRRSRRQPKSSVSALDIWAPQAQSATKDGLCLRAFAKTESAICAEATGRTISSIGTRKSLDRTISMEQFDQTRESAPSEAPQPTTPLVARLANVLAAPGELFEELRSRPVVHANWLVPALLFILSSWVAAALLISSDSIRQQLSQLATQAIEEQVRAGKIQPAQADAAREAAGKWAVFGAAIGMTAGPVFGAFISPFGWGLIIWLGVKVLKCATPFMKAVEFAGLANTVLVLEPIVRALLVLGLGNVLASPSLALLVRDFNPQNTVHGILSAFNLIILWAVAVKAIGLAKLASAQFAKAAVWAFGMWACYTGFFVGVGLVMRAIFAR